MQSHVFKAKVPMLPMLSSNLYGCHVHSQLQEEKIVPSLLYCDKLPSTRFYVVVMEEMSDRVPLNTVFQDNVDDMYGFM